MKPLHALALLAVLVMFAHTMAFYDDVSDTDTASLGCMTDSECEGVAP